MSSKRDLLARLMDGVGLVRVSAAIKSLVESRVTILAYHRVIDVGDEEAFPFDIELVSATPAGFERQMRYVKKYFHPITFDTLLNCLDTGRKIPANAAIVTFDDGFSDNYEFAFPILKRLAVPATIFVSTAYLDDQRKFWYERVAHALMTAKRPDLTLPNGMTVELQVSPSARRHILYAVLSDLKKISNVERLEYIEALDRELDHDPDCDGDPRSGPMTWEQALEMSRAGIEFGSHTVSHPILSKLDLRQLQAELSDSKSRLEQVLGKRVSVIAYPVGGREAISETVLQQVRSSNYRLGATYIPGVQSPSQWDPFALQRVHVERYVSDQLFRASISFPGVFAR